MTKCGHLRNRKTTVAEAGRAFDITPSEIETRVDGGKRGLEYALRAKLENVHSSARGS